MSSYATSSTSVTFTAMAESWAEPAQAEVNVIAFPGGNAVALSLAGRRETTRTFKALMASKADYDLLVSMLGQNGSLTVDNWDQGSISAVMTQIMPDPVQIDGQVLAQVRFILS